MKIAVFENEYQSVSGAFSAANLISFDSKLEIKVFPSSQSAILSEIVEYDVIFIDIDLSAKSEMDGYSVIQELKKIDKDVDRKIAILTGNNKIKDSLNQRNIDSNNLLIIIKPTDFEEITNSINKIRKATS